MELKLTILQYNYWEHFKVAKDLALTLPLDHPRRIEIEKSLNDLQEQIQIIKDGIKNTN